MLCARLKWNFSRALFHSLIFHCTILMRRFWQMSNAIIYSILIYSSLMDFFNSHHHQRHSSLFLSAVWFFLKKKFIKGRDACYEKAKDYLHRAIRESIMMQFTDTLRANKKKTFLQALHLKLFSCVWLSNGKIIANAIENLSRLQGIISSN